MHAHRFQMNVQLLIVRIRKTPKTEIFQKHMSAIPKTNSPKPNLTFHIMIYNNTYWSIPESFLFLTKTMLPLSKSCVNSSGKKEDLIRHHPKQATYGNFMNGAEQTFL